MVLVVVFNDQLFNYNLYHFMSISMLAWVREVLYNLVYYIEHSFFSKESLMYSHELTLICHYDLLHISGLTQHFDNGFPSFFYYNLSTCLTL